jgi:hypothetical protein
MNSFGKKHMIDLYVFSPNRLIFNDICFGSFVLLHPSRVPMLTVSQILLLVEARVLAPTRLAACALHSHSIQANSGVTITPLPPPQHLLQTPLTTPQ